MKKPVLIPVVLLRASYRGKNRYEIELDRGHLKVGDSIRSVDQKLSINILGGPTAVATAWEYYAELGYAAVGNESIYLVPGTRFYSRGNKQEQEQPHKHLAATLGYALHYEQTTGIMVYDTVLRPLELPKDEFDPTVPEADLIHWAENLMV